MDENIIRIPCAGNMSDSAHLLEVLFQQGWEVVRQEQIPRGTKGELCLVLEQNGPK